ncbi:MAG: anaerobic sulfatase maturase [Lachnospiraceae bacterium]
MPSINILIKPASGMCDLNCDYCFYCDLMEKRKQGNYGFMTDDTLEQVISKTLAYADGECSIAFQGGEPTLIGLPFFRKVIDLQKRYNKKQVIIHNSIQTNGNTITDEWCEFFVENKFLVGLSIDGVKHTHDAFRKTKSKEGSYQNVMTTVALLKKYGVEYNVLTVVNRKTAPAIKKIYQNYAKKEFHYQQYIACLDPMYVERGKQEYSLTPEMYGEFLKELFDLWYLDYKLGKYPYIRQFENYIGILLGCESEACEQRGRCSIQNVVEADGSVYPCDFYVMDQYKIGNLNKNTFHEIYHNQNAIHFIQEREQDNYKCEKCKYYRLCKGGCRRQKIQTSELDGVENYFCKSYQMFFSHCLDRMQEIANEIQSFK